MIVKIERGQTAWPGNHHPSLGAFATLFGNAKRGFEGIRIVVSVGGPPKDWDLQTEALPQGLNWELWMGPNTVERPYNNNLAPLPDATFWAKWRDYKEFGGGGMTDWGAHMFDIGQWGIGMDHSGPVKVIPPGSGKQSGLTYQYENGIEIIHQVIVICGAINIQIGALRVFIALMKSW